jgi:hypothetical protein
MNELNPLQKRQALRKIAEVEGFETVTELLENAISECVSPGFCTNPDCGQVSSSHEPDATENWCEFCEKNTVVSAPVLAGII